eukprot:750010-Hanusia_phi.AAC.3
MTGVKRNHPRGGASQYPYNGKKARISPFFAEIVDDTGKRTRVPCKYDVTNKMYVPTGGRDVIPGGKVGTRDKTAEDLQALPLGETDETKLRARQKQIDIGKNTEGYKRLMDQGFLGRQLQDIIGLPYITEEGVLELTLICGKRRYDGYLRMWKRKLYEFAGLQKIDFKSFPPISSDFCPQVQPKVISVCLAFCTEFSPKSNNRKQAHPVRNAPGSSRSWAMRVATS